MEFSEIGERLGDAIKKEASVYYTHTNERNEDITADFILMSLADYLEGIGGTCAKAGKHHPIRERTRDNRRKPVAYNPGR